MSRTSIALAASFLLLALLWLWPLTLAPTALPYRPGAEFSDLTISHWPNAQFIRRSLWEFGQVPLWNPDHLGGQPFAADPLSGMWYPPNWLLALPFLPLSLGFNLLLVAHLAWAGWGMFCFLRAMGMLAGPAFFGGLAFSGMPKLIAHIGAGHVSLVFAVCWTPWLLLAANRAHSFRRGALAGAILGLVFLTDPRWTPMAGVAVLATYLVERGAWKPLAGMAGFALAIAAVLALPLAEFFSFSTRADLSLAESAAFSLPPVYLFGLLVPDLGGFHEYMSYPAVPMLLFAIGGISQIWRSNGPGAPSLTGQRARVALWAGLFLLSLLWALGPIGGLQPLLFDWLPGFSWLRIPARALFLTGLSLSVLSALGLERLLFTTTYLHRKWGELFLAGLALFATLLVSGMALIIGMPPARLIGTAVMITLASAIIVLHSRLRLGSGTLVASACVLTLANLSWVNSTLVEARPESYALGDGVEAAKFLARQPGTFRVYSPSYSLSQHAAVQYGLSQADGVNPLQLVEYVEAMDVASGVPREGYSVTLPSFATGNPRTGNRQYVPNAVALGLLNVGYMVSGFPIQAEGLIEEARFDETWLYRNEFFQPRAWGSSSLTTLPLKGPGDTPGIAEWVALNSSEAVELDILRWTPNRIELRVQGASYVVLTGVSYPGWEAHVGARAVPLAAPTRAQRVIQLAPSETEISLVFRPWSVYAGLGITLIALLTLGALWWRGKD